MYKKEIDSTSGTAAVVASNVRAESARQGYSQMELARTLGFSQGMITKRWKGQVAWQLAELDLVSAVLGVSVIDLVKPVHSMMANDVNVMFEPARRTMNPIRLNKQYAIRDSNPEPTD